VGVAVAVGVGVAVGVAVGVGVGVPPGTRKAYEYGAATAEIGICLIKHVSAIAGNS
jgi:hypothetical protein